MIITVHENFALECLPVPQLAIRKFAEESGAGWWRGDLGRVTPAGQGFTFFRTLPWPVFNFNSASGQKTQPGSE